MCHVQVHIITSLGIGAHNCRYISAAATYVFKSDSKQLPWSIMKRMFGKDIVQQCLELLDRKRVKQMRVGKVYAPYVHIWDNVMSSSKPFMCVWCFLYCAWGGGGVPLCLSFMAIIYISWIWPLHTLLCVWCLVSVKCARWQLRVALKFGPNIITYVQVRGWTHFYNK